jgi:CDP-diacylglycerol--glycerol-3-phosphate 3-phosphatidyltransferase
MIPQPAPLVAKGYPMNLANLLTLLRLAALPFLVAVFYLGGAYRFELTAALFLLAAATDLVDGYVARRREQVTNLGKLLDPVADKLLITTAVLLLVEAGRLWAWLAILLIGRELAVTGLRAVASSQGKVMQAEGMGKLKMIFQVIGLAALFLGDPAAHPWIWEAGVIIVGAAVILALVSGGRYAWQVGRLFGLRQ